MKHDEFVPGTLFQIDYGFPDLCSGPSKYWEKKVSFILLSSTIRSEQDARMLYSLTGESHIVRTGPVTTRVKVSALGPEGDFVNFAGNPAIFLKVETSTEDE